MKWSLVLSGGGAKGLAYIGLLNALHDFGYPEPNLIAGCSIGAFIGGVYASGMNPADMTDFVMTDFSLKNYITNPVFSIPDSLIAKPFQIGGGITRLLTQQGIEHGKKIFSLIQTLTRNISIEDCRIPFRCNAVDLITGKEHVFKTGPAADAIRASISFPGILTPHQIDNAVYTDGYIKHNTPVWIAHQEHFHNILAVELDTFSAIMPHETSKGLEVIMRSIDIAINTQEKRQIDIPTAILKISDEYSSIDFNHIEERIRSGYTAVENNRKMLDDFFSTQPIIGFFKRTFLYKQTAQERQHVPN